MQIDSGGTLKLVGSSLFIYGSVVVQTSATLATDAQGEIQTLTNSSCTELNYCDPSQATGTLQGGGETTQISVVLSGVVGISTSNGATVCPLTLFGSWSGTTCTVQSGFTVSYGATLNIGAGVTVNGGSFSTSEVQFGVLNSGTINNLGTLTGTCDTGGDCIGIQSDGIINNNGTVSGNGNGAGGINSNGDIYNYGVLSGPGNGVENYGNIFNYGTGTVTGVGQDGASGIYNQADIYNYGTLSAPTGSVIRNFGSGATIWNTGIIVSGGGIVNDCGVSGGALTLCPTIFNDGNIGSAALAGDGGYAIQNEGTIVDYCGVTITGTFDTISTPPTAVSCYNITFTQTGLPSTAHWGVSVLWVFGPIQYSGAGSSISVKLANGPFGVINYAFSSPVTSSGNTYYCSSGCTVYNVVLSSARTFAASYLQQTTTSVSCSPSSVNGAAPTTCTATVNGGPSPTGTVTFGSTSGAGSFTPSNDQCTLSSGSCSVKYADAKAGSPTITASYGGDSRNGPSSGTTSPTILTTVYYDVTFSVSGIPTSDLSSWGVNVNGVEYTQSNAGTTSLNVFNAILAYPQTFQFDGLVSAGAAGQYACTTGCSGTLTGSGGAEAIYVSTAVLSQASCISAEFGGSWSGSTCTVNSASIASGQSLQIPGGVSLAIDDDGAFTNSGTINIAAGGSIVITGGYFNANGVPGETQLTNDGVINNAGTIYVQNSQSDHYGDGNDGVDNYGTINNSASGAIDVANRNGVGIWNYGTILNSGDVDVENVAGLYDGYGNYGIYNQATFTNQGCGALTGNDADGYNGIGEQGPGIDSFGISIPSGGCNYSVTFNQLGVPSGVNWGVTVGGTDYRCSTYCTSPSVGTSLVVPTSVAGSLTISYSYDSPVPGYTCSSGCSGSAPITGPTTLPLASYVILAPIVTTTPSSSAIHLGGPQPTLKDTATITGGLSPTGTVTFTLVAPGGVTVDTEAVTVSGDGSYSTPNGFTLPLTGVVAGTYQWDAAYSGDGTNGPASDNGAVNEQVDVLPATTSILTVASPTTLILGGSTTTLDDSATLSGGYNPTGTITFTLAGPGSVVVDTEIVDVSGAGTYTTPSGYALTLSSAAGIYQWAVQYSGDSNNIGAPGANPEQVTISPASPSLAISCAPPSVASGTSTTCTATVTGASGAIAGETISFASSSATGVFAPVGGSCQLSSSGSCSVSYADPTSGAPVVTASYPGDSNNGASSGAYIEANFAVAASSAESSETTLSGGSVLVNQTSQTGVSISISGSSGNSATVFSADLGTTQPTGTGTISLVGSQYYDVKVSGISTGTAEVCITTSTPLASVATLQYWDGSEWTTASNINISGSQICGGIPVSALTGTNVVVGETIANPTIASTPSSSTITLGTSAVTLTDSATLSDGNNPTGMITFTLVYNGLTVDTENAAVTGNGVYTTPTGYTLPGTGTIIGTYQWNASYSGDVKNDPVSDNNATNEQVVVNAASPTISTTPSLSSVILGSNSVTLEDTATLSGGFNPGGTLTFTLVLGGNAVDTETVTVSGDGTYQTPTGYTLPASGTAAGSYQWNSVYSGDANNDASSDIGAANERVTVGAASPTLTTTASPSSVTLGGSTVTLRDSATLSGGYAPGGTITFVLSYDAITLDIETVTVTGNGVYNTPTGYTLPTTGDVAGAYMWQVNYNGDGNNHPASEVGATEQTTVIRASPSIVTTPSPASATLGITPQTLTDSAVVSGGYHEGGTLTFSLKAPGGQIVDTETLTVNGDGTYSTPAGYTLTSGPGTAGIYQWAVQYSGDGNNVATTGSNVEDVTVTQGVPTLTTTASPPSATLGGSSPELTDSATIGGGANPMGTLTFTLNGPGGAVVDTETVTVNGDGTYSTPVGFVLPSAGSVVGTYQWDASYSGDASNFAVSDVNAVSEQTVISSASPTIVTTPSPTSANLSAGAPTLGDTATLASGYFETGTLTFTLTGPGGSIVDTETVTVTGNGVYTTPTGYTLPATGTVAGTYQWDAAYGGDSNNNAASASDELVVVSPASSSIATSVFDASTSSPWTTSEVTGASAYDTAVVTGVAGFAPTGTLTYALYSGDSCSGAAVSTATVALSGGSVPSSPTTAALAAGAYSYGASYSGDGNYVGSMGTCEAFSVSPAGSSISTSVYDASTGSSWSGTEVAGAAAYDNSIVTGVIGFAPTGTATYQLFAGNSCSGSFISTSTGSLTGVLESAKTGPLATGSYSFSAAYSGDSNYAPASGSCESFSVLRATVSPSTTVSSSGTVIVGNPAIDTVNLSGGFNPTGSVTFTVYSNSACTTSVSSSTEALSGGSATSSSFTPTVTGTYYWGVTYSGDANNNGLSTPCGPSGETLTATLRATSTAVACSPASILVGLATTCTATVTDTSPGTATAPTGTVTFSTNNAGTFTSSSCTLAEVSASAASCSVTYTPASGHAGTHDIGASYGGDATHSSSASTFALTAVGQPTNTFLICLPTFTTVDSPVLCITTVTSTGFGGPTPTGTVTFMTDNVGTFNPSSTCTLTQVLPGIAACSAAYTPSPGHEGTHHITASYSGSLSSAASTSSAAAIAVTQRATVATLTCSGPTLVGVASTCTAMVSDVGFGTPLAPTGSVSFASTGSGSFGAETCTTSGSSLICAASYTQSRAGVPTVRASYAGDTDHTGSSASSPLGVFDFTVTISSPGAAIGDGGSTTATVSVGPVPGSPTSGLPSVSLTLSGLPAGITATGFPSSLQIGGSGTFTLESSASYVTCSQVSNRGGQNLKGANLSGCNLQGYDLAGDNLQSANLQGADLARANLQGANLQSANLAGVDAAGANFQGANLNGADLSSGVSLSTFTLTATGTLNGASRIGSLQFTKGGSDLSGANFQGANLQGANVSGDIATDASFQGANLSSSNMSYGDFDYSNFQGANTHGANITGATFVGAVSPP